VRGSAELSLAIVASGLKTEIEARAGLTFRPLAG